MKQLKLMMLPAVALALGFCLLPRVAAAEEVGQPEAARVMSPPEVFRLAVREADERAAIEHIWVTYAKHVLAGDADAMKIDPQEIVILGDYAYARGLYTVSSKTGDVAGMFMTILKRQDDGSWAIYRDVFNLTS